MEKKYTWEDFRSIISRLRAPDGCPWDRQQTHESLRNCMIEEAYEAVDGIRILKETGDSSSLQEELGDVLMQVFLHSQIAEEEGNFTLEDVVDGISRKMIYRHPHVFGSAKADTPDQVLQNWEELKKIEKGNPTAEEEIAAVPRCLPALIRAQKIQKKLEKYYGAFQNDEDSFREAEEALKALKQETDPEKAKEQAGSLLLQISNLLRLKTVNGEESLADALENLLKIYEIKESP